MTDNGKTIYEAFESAVREHGQRPFLRAPASSTKTYAPGAIEYSYVSAMQQVQRLASAYQKIGVQPGNRVAIAYDSRLDVYLHLLALNALGASIVPLNMTVSDGELHYFLDHSDTTLITGADEHLERLGNIAGTLEHVSVIAANSFDVDVRPITAVGTSDTEAALLYTSGTTGKPKGCMLSNEYFLTMGREYNGLGGYCVIDADDRLLTPLPPNHMNALSTSFMAMLMCGGCVIQLDRFHPRNWWQTVREEMATVIHYLGVMPAILLTFPEEKGDHLQNQIKFGFGAGSDPRHQAVFESRFGFPLIEAWAMTESGAGGMIVANRDPRHLGKRCIGRPIPSMQLRVVDNEDNDVPSGVDGELLVRSGGAGPRAGYFSGYYKDDRATEEGWKGGWWHTGDVVRCDDDGLLYFVDRRKNVIRRSGENIAAVEVEAALLASDIVDNCAVTAVPDEMRGDEVFAFIVASKKPASCEELADEIFAHCNSLLTYFKAPGYIEFTDVLPLTASQKVSRAEVKRLARVAVDSGSCVDFRSQKRRAN